MTDRQRQRMKRLRLIGVVVILLSSVVSYLLTVDLLGIPPIQMTVNHCPNSQFACPGTKFSMDPRSYIVFLANVCVAAIALAVLPKAFPIEESQGHV